jgi:hypothetical protein
MHGWRAFLGEVGVVLLGVLLALGAQQIVEALNWRNEVAQARTALGFEMADSMGQSYERDIISLCLDRRLDEISAILNGALRTGRLPPIGRIGGPPYRAWLTNVWTTTNAGQTASHFRRYDLSQYGTFYEFVRHAAEDSRTELAVWSNLRSIEGPGRVAAPDELAFLLRSVEEARSLNTLVEVSGLRLREVAAGAHFPYDRPTVEEYRKRTAAEFPLTCRPISAQAPTRYGASDAGPTTNLSKTDPLHLR